ncbi:dihydroorotate dehydrogenase [Pseudokineococcus sp. 1T1Z-3]|uniref:dihydroorotate dehydrogenase n=1 Tax=Pseudokineococcus sp. 1T1Z-3 TaxID=3132745 RepID=UPI00309AC0B5
MSAAAEVSGGAGEAVAGGVDMGVDLAGARLPGPVMTASGCAAAGRELDAFTDVAALGAVVTKSVMLAARSGRPTPRMAETPAGMLNSIGLQGGGVDALVEHDLPWLAGRGARAVVSVAGGDAAEFAEVARRVVTSPAAAGVAALEVNISCPNVANRGLVFACDPGSSAAVLAAVRAAVGDDVVLLAKLSPDVTDLVAVARACLEAGASGLTAINTLLGVDVDVRTMRPRLAVTTGGLSGPAIRPVAVRCVWQLRAAMLAGLLPTAPVVGTGGVASGADALQLVLAGASAVQVGTAVFADPGTPGRVAAELETMLAERGFRALGEAVGYAHRP